MPGIATLLETSARDYVVETSRTVCNELRETLLTGDTLGGDDLDAEIVRRVRDRVAAGSETGPQRAINATGVVLHTNLGRARLPESAVTALLRVARGASALELDVATGARGERDRIVEEDLLALTGAEAATVVNNNAAAVLLALNSLAEGKRVVVSRGELVEIGGSFRIPDIMAKSGARLVEVGTTNRTHARDFERALDDGTGAILKVHASNYRIVGFTTEVPLEKLCAIGKRHGVPIIEDLGSGALVDLARWGLPREPVVAERVAAGADVVTFSGDKLLGGPQAGILVGRREVIEKIRRNPLKRALRCDKLTLAALAAVLRIYRRSPDLSRTLPTLRALTRPIEEMRKVGGSAIEQLRAALGGGFEISLVESKAEVGSGAQPTEALPSLAIAIHHGTESPDRIARRFRAADPAILGRIHDGQFLLDLRLIDDPSDLVPR